MIEKSLLSLFKPPENFSFNRGAGTTYSVNEKTLTALERILCGYNVNSTVKLRKDFHFYFQQGEYDDNNPKSRCIQAVNPENGCLHAKFYMIEYGDGEKKIYRTIIASANLTNEDELNVFACFDSEEAGIFEDFYKNGYLYLCDMESIKITEDITVYNPQTLLKGNDIMSRDVKEAKKITVVSPFLSDGLIEKFVKDIKDIHMVSREDMIEGLTNKADNRFHFYVLKNKDDCPETLHAKLYIFEKEKESIIYLGSANATYAAFNTNTETLVRIKADIKSDKLLAQFEPYKPGTNEVIPAEEDPLDELCRKIIAVFKYDENKYEINGFENVHIKLDGIESKSMEWERKNKGNHSVEICISDESGQHSKIKKLFINSVSPEEIKENAVRKEIYNELIYMINQSSALQDSAQGEQSVQNTAVSGTGTTKKPIPSFTKAIYSTRAKKAKEKISGIKKVMELTDDEELKKLLENGIKAIEEVFGKNEGQQ